jgi:hypothetical protein
VRPAGYSRSFTRGGKRTAKARYVPHRTAVTAIARSCVAAPPAPIAGAQTYPARPVRLVVGYAAGGGTDITARLIAQWLSERLGQQFVVENRAGAATNIGTEAVVHAPADGYTLLLAHTANAINATLYENTFAGPPSRARRSGSPSLRSARSDHNKKSPGIRQSSSMQRSRDDDSVDQATAPDFERSFDPGQDRRGTEFWKRPAIERTISPAKNP